MTTIDEAPRKGERLEWLLGDFELCSGLVGESERFDGFFAASGFNFRLRQKPEIERTLIESSEGLPGKLLLDVRSVGRQILEQSSYAGVRLDAMAVFFDDEEPACSEAKLVADRFDELRRLEIRFADGGIYATWISPGTYIKHEFAKKPFSVPEHVVWLVA